MRRGVQLPLRSLCTIPRHSARIERVVTCIVGLEHKGAVWMAGDSAGVAGLDLTVRSDAKVFLNGPYVMGFTTSFRMGQILRWSFEPPKPPKEPEYLECFMATDFVNGVRTTLSAGGYATKKNEAEEGGTFLVGVRGVLWCVDSDFQVGRAEAGYDAVGCGEGYAKGALYATQGKSPAHRLQKALEAAEAHSAGVRGPYTVEVVR